MDSNAANYRPDIDGLRGLAVLLVVLYHFFPGVVPAGFVGVDIFFVISGYLITGLLLRQISTQHFSLLDFYQRRVVRLLPTLILVMATAFVVAWFNLLPAQFKALGLQLAAGAGFVANFLMWRESGYFGGEAALKPMLHLWSLAIEEQFYLFWPLVLLGLMRFRKGALPGVLVVLTVASFGVNLWSVRSDPSAAFYGPLSRFWELSVGALLALRQAHATPSDQPRPASWVQQTLAVLGVLLLLIAVARITPQRPFPGTWALLPTLGAALLLAAGPLAWVNRHLLSRWWLRWPGLISYAWYLWHWPLLAFAHLEWGETLGRVQALSLLLLSLALAIASTYLLEHPLRFGQFWRLHRARLSAVLLLGLTLVGYAGWNVYQRDGLAFRLPSVIRQMTEPPVDMFAGWGRGSCLLERHQQATDYQASCIDVQRPLIFVWGDSHAAALMPGLKHARDSMKMDQLIGLAQRTAATCPPFPRVSEAWCRSLNDDTLAQIRLIKPEVVVLHAFWTFDFYDLSQLTESVDLLKQAGVGRVLVLGAPPAWQPPLPQQLLKAWESGPPAMPAPFRLSEGVTPNTFAREDEAAALAKAAGAEYVSMLKLLCNAQGCQTRDTATSEHLLSHDYGHLSLEGATWVAKEILPGIVGR